MEKGPLGGGGFAGVIAAVMSGPFPLAARGISYSGYPIPHGRLSFFPLRAQKG